MRRAGRAGAEMLEQKHRRVVDHLLGDRILPMAIRLERAERSHAGEVGDVGHVADKPEPRSVPVGGERVVPLQLREPIDTGIDRRHALSVGARNAQRCHKQCEHYHSD
jgi:hypothetical protein